MPTEAAVRCASLVKIYPSATRETHALRGVEASFWPGTLTAVTGPSGSGKSSLLQVLALHERPSGGRLWVLGDDVSTLRGRGLRALRRTRVAWVAQRPTHSLFGHLTARGNLEQVARLRGVTRAEGEGLLERLGIAHRSRARTDALSGGEQQRLAVAAALLGTPAVVLADEPTAELDDASATLVLAELARCASRGSAVVFATHDARAVRAAGRVLHMRHGVLSSERDAGGTTTAPIDASGRVQLPPEALALFPDDRAVVQVADGRVLLRRPDDQDGDPS
jgi:putative ABC transport system ATP-binding protein